jgi:hypothetical protein
MSNDLNEQKNESIVGRYLMRAADIYVGLLYSAFMVIGAISVAHYLFSNGMDMYVYASGGLLVLLYAAGGAKNGK